MKQVYTHRTAIGRSRPARKLTPAVESEPLYTAKDDDLIRKKPSTAQLVTQWAQNINAAKIAWVKLTHSELMQSEGSEQKLTSLIARRYNVSTASAQQQVHRFFQQRTY